MATRRFGISRGENMGQVTEAVGAAVAADGVEVTIDLAAITSKEQALLALEYIEAHIIKGNWPPA